MIRAVGGEKMVARKFLMIVVIVETYHSELGKSLS